jgi:hypothetical protein
MKHTNDEPPRYCTNHQGVYPVAGGVWLSAGRTRRWICASCRARRNAAKQVRTESKLLTMPA